MAQDIASNYELPLRVLTYRRGVGSSPTSISNQQLDGERVSRNRSPWFSLGYLLAVAVIVLLIVLFVLWLA